MLMFQFDTVYLECISIALNKQVTRLEVIDERPPFALHIEGMIEGCFNRLVTHMDAVYLIRLMVERIRYFFISCLAGLFIFRENLISDFNVFDILLPFVS